jgi:peptide/nickel transport system permease protein
VAATLAMLATLELARAVLLESTLSFLGAGLPPPTPSWGGMIQEGREYLEEAWWIALGPGTLLVATSLAASRLGDGLRDLLDPAGRDGG